jgi:nucleotide-binding universal stress UspA family protein
MTGKTRIVVGVDGSHSSPSALRWAADQASHTGGELYAVSAWMPLPVTHTLGGIAPHVDVAFDPRQNALKALEATLLDVLGEDGVKNCRRDVIEGNAAEVLIRLSGDADLLVVGTRGHGGFAGLLLGSVSQHVAVHAACTVVVVREK